MRPLRRRRRKLDGRKLIARCKVENEYSDLAARKVDSDDKAIPVNVGADHFRTRWQYDPLNRQCHWPSRQQRPGMVNAPNYCRHQGTDARQQQHAETDHQKLEAAHLRAQFSRHGRQDK